MACKKKLYFNPFEVPYKIHYVSTAKNIDATYEPCDTPNGYPVWFEDLFKAIKRGDFDEIIVSVSEHEECYYPEKVAPNIYKRVPLVGEISLSEFSKGGGYLEDKHIYVE